MSSSFLPLSSGLKLLYWITCQWRCPGQPCGLWHDRVFRSWRLTSLQSCMDGSGDKKFVTTHNRKMVRWSTPWSSQILPSSEQSIAWGRFQRPRSPPGWSHGLLGRTSWSQDLRSVLCKWQHLTLKLITITSHRRILGYFSSMVKNGKMLSLCKRPLVSMTGEYLGEKAKKTAQLCRIRHMKLNQKHAWWILIYKVWLFSWTCSLQKYRLQLPQPISSVTPIQCFPSQPPIHTISL